MPKSSDTRHPSPLEPVMQDQKTMFFGAYAQGPLAGLRSQTRRYPMVIRLLNTVIHTLCGPITRSTLFLSRNRAIGLHTDPNNHRDVPNYLIPLSNFEGGQLFIESQHGDYSLEEDGMRGYVHETLSESAQQLLKDLGLNGQRPRQLWQRRDVHGFTGQDTAWIDVARVLQAGSIARYQNPAMDQETARPDERPFLVLSDSTLQHLLFSRGKGQSYGVESVMGGYAIISPGATLVAPYKSTPHNPPVLEILAWHFIQVLEASSRSTTTFPVQHQGLKQCLVEAFHRPVNVGLIPLRESLPSHKQGAYNWLADVRDEY
ncbi:GALNT6, partial [Symbiodinium necroappetens]